MKAAIYIRVSTERQAEEGFSLEAQQDILMELIDRKGLELYRAYSDPGVSGSSFKRPGVQAMITDMKAKKFDALLVHKLDRLSRNQGDLYEFINLINKLDVRLIIADQGSEEIDTRSPMGKAFLQFSGIWAELYLNNLREETLKGLVKKAQKGGKHISRPPLGYEFDGAYNLKIVEEEAALIREVFNLYLHKGWGVVRIAKHMNGFSRGKEGGLWDSKRVRTIITNPTYSGYNHFKPVQWADDKRIMNDGIHEAIISREDFEKAQTYIDRRAKNQMSKRSFEYAYSGIVKCAECGSNYTGNSTVSNEKVYKSYRCFNNYVRDTCAAPSITERQINALVFEKILLMDDKVQEKKNTKEEKKERYSIQKEVEASNKRRKNWMMALGDGKLSGDDYAMLIEEEDARMKTINDAINEAAAASEPEIPVDQLKQMIIELRNNWEYLDADIQKEAIQNMFRKIVIKKEENGWKLDELLTV